jgi:hypothetical protein
VTSTDRCGQKVSMDADVFVLPVVQEVHTIDLSSRRIARGGCRIESASGSALGATNGSPATGDGVAELGR